jgi:hypothetical protein
MRSGHFHSTSGYCLKKHSSFTAAQKGGITAELKMHAKNP